MNSEVDLVLNGPDGDDVKNAAQDCLQQAAVRSILAGIIGGYASGGTAAISAAVAEFASTIDSCMEAKLTQQLDVTAQIVNPTSWDNDWS
jgi:hypothetical protein